jgi:uncharacterized protein
MDPASLILLAALAAVAALYASVGQGGASGYLAVLALAGLAPEELRPAALALSLLVAIVATFRFGGAGHLRVRLLVPFLLPSVPAAFLGGSLALAPGVYRILLGLVLLFAAWRIAIPARAEDDRVSARYAGDARGHPPPLAVAIAVGTAIGLFSGLVGVGGGIFLSPVLLLAGWATPREAAAVSAPFILFNSGAALSGQLAVAGATLPLGLPLWLGAVLLGGWAGATFGSRHARPHTLRLIFSAALLIAGGKLLLGV